MKMKLYATLTSLLAMPALVYANHYENRWALGAQYGIIETMRPDDMTFKDRYDDDRAIGGTLQYGLSHDLSLVASYTNLLLEDKITKDELELQPMMLSFKYHPLTKTWMVPYLKAGAGFSANRQEISAPGMNDNRWNKFAAAGGAGLEFFVNPGLSIGVEGLYHHIVATADQSPYRLVTGMGFMNVYFGEDESTKELRDQKRKAEEEAERMRQQAQQTQAERDAAAAQAAAAQQAASSAQQAADAAAAGQNSAQAELQAMQQQVQQAQAEMTALKEMIEQKQINPINFETGSDKLLVDSYPTLDKVAESAKKYPNLKLRVEGHTDAVGNDASNLRLSQRRSESVRKYLVDKAGVPAEQVNALGLGETKPIADNETAEGRAQNRRVEFIFSISQ